MDNSGDDKEGSLDLSRGLSK